MTCQNSSHWPGSMRTTRRSGERGAGSGVPSQTITGTVSVRKPSRSRRSARSAGRVAGVIRKATWGNPCSRKKARAAAIIASTWSPSTRMQPTWL